MWYVPTFTLFDFIVLFILYKIIMRRAKKYEKEEEEIWKKCNEEMKRIMQEMRANNERTIAELRKKKLEQERNELLAQMGKLKPDFPKEAR